MSLRCRLGVPWIHSPGVPPKREDGVPKLRGEVVSISEVGRFVGGEEISGGPGLERGDRTRLRELGGAEESMSSEDGGEVTLWRRLPPSLAAGAGLGVGIK